MKMVCISDTHLHEPSVPDGDVLVHAGDATFNGTLKEVSRFAKWFLALPHKHKIFVPGNHDFLFEHHEAAARQIMGGENVHVLIDEEVVVGGVKFWGTPWQPDFGEWAFNKPRGPALQEHWDWIPLDTDVLVTHCPPFGVGDLTLQAVHAGDFDLLLRLEDVDPKFHVFGHIHEAYGLWRADALPHTAFVNAALCNRRYENANDPIVVET